MNCQPPWKRVHLLPPDGRAELRRRAIFECCKWDPQVEDVDTLAPLAVVLQPCAWRELARLAQALYAETLALEEALLKRPDLHRALALPRRIRHVLAHPAIRNPARRGTPDLRVMRFDFHPTEEGWRVSEVNSDVPGGYNEASGWSALVAPQVPEARQTADPASMLARQILARVPEGGTVALVHATAYTDDRQVMTFLARRLQQEGLRPVLVGPDHIHWREGRALIDTDWFAGQADFLFRFFPAEWLPNLDRRVEWSRFFGASLTPQCNPATALLSQGKRWPLLLDQLEVALPTWGRLLPETVAPREADWRRHPAWVVKPAMGRVGEWVGMHSVTSVRDWKAIRRSLRWGSRHWVAQRRFRSMPLVVHGEPWHICFGVYVIDGWAAGIYGRMASEPLINHTARDLAVLVDPDPIGAPSRTPAQVYESIGTV